MKYLTVVIATALLGVQVAAAQGQSRTIVGQVTDQRSGEPLSVGQVLVLGTNVRDRLRPDGVFVVHVQGEVTLAVSSMGYRAKEVTVPTNQTVVRVALEVDVMKLERLVVTGRSSELERRHLANAVASLASEDINRVPATSLEATLHGKVAGLQVKQNSAAPGGGNLLRLRGISSLLGPGEPLYVVDGVIVSDARLDVGMNAISLAEGRGRISSSQSSAINRIADLNPNDIADIQILRGAAATTMYGSRGTNGVVIIKTKRGGG